jgi:hypothetical protein
MTALASREVRLVRRPEGLPTEEDFEIVQAAVTPPGDGEILVRNLWMSVDPYMRGRMRPGRSYVSPYEVGQVLDGGCVGRVVSSRHSGFEPGDWVLADKGWRELWKSDGDDAHKIDPGIAPPQSYLGVMGMPGLTAYVGLNRVFTLTGNETVLVTAAAGAVGSVACQIAKLEGCRVIGTAGSAEKTAWLRDEIGLDAAIDHRPERRLAVALHRACPEGFDLCFDNVGGRHLEAALQNMKVGGRVVICGMISQYNERPNEPYSERRAAPGPRNLIQLIIKRLTLRGFIVNDHTDLEASFRARMAVWLASGAIKSRETIVKGLENAPSAFIGLFTGANIGKMLVRLPED